ncbi:MAG: hypothetical protein QOI16_1327, partial [Pseudonocardiales bacterium]|nr:hypothetical protein [Pseudonocardiales bacterium]
GVSCLSTNVTSNDAEARRRPYTMRSAELARSAIAFSATR